MSVEQASRQQNVKGGAFPNQVDQPLHFLVADGYAQAGGRDAQPAVFRGYPEVGGYRQLAAAADGESSYHGNGGGAHVGQLGQHLVDRLVVSLGLGGVGPVFVEVCDVRPGGKGTVAGAGDDNGPDVRVGVQRLQQPGQLQPHAKADSVALSRTVDGDGCYGSVSLHQDFVVHGHMIQPVRSVRARKRWPPPVVTYRVCISASPKQQLVGRSTRSGWVSRTLPVGEKT